MGGDTGRRVQKFHGAISDIHAQLMCKDASIAKRIGILNSTGVPAMLWSIESCPVLRSQIDRLSGLYVSHVFKMLGKRYHDSFPISYGQWYAEMRHFVARLIEQHGGSIMVQVLRRHWRYAGHVARSPNRDLIRLLDFRSEHE
eukprot:6755784-Karenia_brevis.AAC.1